MTFPKRDPNKETKNCIICGTLFKRFAGVSNKEWNKRKCCSFACSCIVRRKDTAQDRAIKLRKNWEVLQSEVQSKQL